MRCSCCRKRIGFWEWFQNLGTCDKCVELGLKDLQKSLDKKLRKRVFYVG